MTTRACEQCGAELVGRGDARYCSDACKQAAHRARAKASAETGQCPTCEGLLWVDVIRDGEHDGMLPCPDCRPERRRYVQGIVRRVEAEHEARGGGS